VATKYLVPIESVNILAIVVIRSRNENYHPPLPVTMLGQWMTGLVEKRRAMDNRRLRFFMCNEFIAL
jgi:hypothetical protein